jgi:GH24 family phage-related lysozyme (muramidase)
MTMIKLKQLIVESRKESYIGRAGILIDNPLKLFWAQGDESGHLEILYGLCFREPIFKKQISQIINSPEFKDTEFEDNYEEILPLLVNDHYVTRIIIEDSGTLFFEPFNSGKNVTQKQLKYLKDFCIEHGYKLVQDFGNSKFREISLDESINMTDVPNTETDNIVHQEKAPANIVSDGRFRHYIKEVENDEKVGFEPSKNLWYPYEDPAGWHIGYGHLIEGENELKHFKKGISEERIEELLDDDLSIANQRVKDYIKEKYDVNILLTKEQDEMLTDFAFNLGGLDKFPKFVHAVLHDDKEEMRKEYKRYFHGKELMDRNEKFYNEFLR